jgi:Tfp pilus assembly protein PilF
MALQARTLRYPFVLDDATYIFENPVVADGAPLGRVFFDPTATSSNAKPEYRNQVWRPLRLLAFRAIVKLFGPHPEAVRVWNILLYGLAAALVLLIALRLLDHLGAAIFAAAIWAAWPVHVEAVVYASALGDQISLVCVLGAVLVAERSLAASVLLGAAAMLSKEMAVTTPALVALWLWTVGAPRKKTLVALFAHGAMALLYLIVRTKVVGHLGQGETSTASIGEGILGAARLALVYARITLAPLGHSAAYTLAPAGVAWRLLAWLLALGVCVAGWRVRSIRFGLLWFLLALAPVLQLVPVAADFGDRFVLQPSIGLAIAAVGAVLLLPARAHRLAAALGGIAILMWAGGTFAEQYAWSSELLLWRHAVDLQPDSVQAHANYGTVLLHEDKPEAALAELDLARAMGWGGRELELRRSMALLGLGRIPEADIAARRAILRDPTLGRAYAMVGHIAALHGDLATAEAQLALAEQYEPEQVSVALLDAEVAQERGRLAEAAQKYAAISARFPTAARFQYLAARSALDAGDLASAATHARACLAEDAQSSQCREILDRVRK